MRSVSFGLTLMAATATVLAAEESPEVAVYLSTEYTCPKIEDLTPTIAREHGRLIFDQSEITAVDWMNQVFHLSVPINDRLHVADVYGAGFWLFVDGEPIYRGVHMPAISSVSCDQVHLAVDLFDNGVVEIETGRPRGLMESPDPRRDPRLLDALRRLAVIEKPPVSVVPASITIGKMLVIESVAEVELPFAEGAFASRLPEVLGEPSRHHYDCDDVWLWDDFGIALRKGAGNHREWWRLSFHLIAGEHDGQPREAFRGRISAGSLPIQRGTRFDELVTAGFERLGATELAWTPAGGTVRLVVRGADAVERLFVEAASEPSRPIRFSVETWGETRPSLDEADRKVAYMRERRCSGSGAELKFRLAHLEGSPETEPGVAPPRPLALKTPVSREALEQGAGGVVLIDLLIATDGTVSAAKPVSWPDWYLRREAAVAVLGWTFRPARRNGKAVSAIARAAINFRLR